MSSVRREDDARRQGATDPEAHITRLQIDLERCLARAQRAEEEAAFLRHTLAEIGSSVSTLGAALDDFERLRKEKGWRKV